MMTYETVSMDSKQLFQLLARANTTPNMRREVLEGLDTFAKATVKVPLSFENYSTYLSTVHDILVRADTTVKSQLLRIIRYGLTSPVHGEEIILQVGLFTTTFHQFILYVTCNYILFFLNVF